MSVNVRQPSHHAISGKETAAPHSRLQPDTASAIQIAYRPPLLVASFAEAHDILSWSVTRPGFAVAQEVAWLELRNTDLPIGTDADAVIRTKLAAAGHADAVALVTSRDISRYHQYEARVDTVSAGCVTTVGLSNGERIGERSHLNPPGLGTINTLLRVSRPLTHGALVEAVAMVASARTAAVLDSGVHRDGVAITGTGTDCIAVAAPRQGEAERFVGMHTALGEAIGAAVYNATREGIATWQIDYAAYLQTHANAPL